jgi:thymidine kinase
MNAGKSTILLQSSYNYRERGMNTLILLPEIDTRFQAGKVTSRIGIEADARTFTTAENLLVLVERLHGQKPIDCVLVDEAQFLTKNQVRQLSDICDRHDIPVLAYGLRTDFQGNLFQGSEHLLAWADTLSEIKTICHCGSKATMVLRIDAQGKAIKDGRQVQIGGNDRYLSVCRRHFKEGMSQPQDDELPLIDY